jgi:outer membrane protein assembly factor BamB
VVIVVGLAAMSVLPLSPFRVYHPERPPVADAALAQLWTTRPGGPGERQIGGAAVVDGTLVHTETLFAGPRGVVGSIHRQNLLDGTDLGTLVSVPDRAFGQLAAVDGALVVASTAGGEAYLSSYGPDGRLNWDAAAPGDGFVVAGDTVVAYGRGGVAALSTAGGAVRWNVPRSALSAVVAAGTVVATDGRVVTGYAAQAGTPEWSASVGAVEVVAAGDRVVAVGDDGVCAFAAGSGLREWCGAPALSAVASGGTLYTVGDGTVGAVDAATGDVRWSRSFANGWAVSTSLWRPAVADGTVYAVGYHFDGGGKQRHELVAVRAADGGGPYQVPFELGAEHGGEPLVAGGGQVFFAGIEAVYAFGAPAT